MNDIYIITYHEHALSMGGRGKDTVQGYAESIFDAEEYIKRKGECYYGNYRIDVVKSILV